MYITFELSIVDVNIPSRNISCSIAYQTVEMSVIADRFDKINS